MQTKKPHVRRHKERKQYLTIDYKLARLILNSEAIHTLNVDVLIKHLEINGELSKKDQETLGLDASVITNIIKTCQAEWDYHKNGFKILSDNYEGDPISCQLCDQPNLKNIHQVINKKSKATWNIGRNCADEFGDNIKKSLKEIEVLHVKTLALQQLNEQVPGVVSYTENEQKNFNKADTILPSSLHNKKQNSLAELNNSIQKYYKKPHQEILQEIKILFKDNVEQDHNIQFFKEQNQNNLLYPTPKIVHWLRRNDSLGQTISNIRNNNGLIPKSDFYKISEIDFIKALLLKIKSPNLTVLNNNQLTKFINFKIAQTGNNAILEMDTPNFLTVFTECIWDEPFNKKTIKEELLTEAKLSPKLNSHISIFKQYESLFNSLGYEIIMNKYDKNDLILKTNSNYLKINNEKFLQNIKDIHLNLKPAEHISIRNIIDDSIYKEYDDASWKNYMDIAENAASLAKNIKEK